MTRRDRAIVVPQHRTVFWPIPKSGCTSLKWQLAALSGLPRERFVRSRAKDVSHALAIHDMALWPEENRWSALDDAERRAIVADERWLRFTVVRDPAARLWSAWQSKILLQEPRFVLRFGHEPWFPRGVDSPDRVVGAFRAFVHALADAGSAPRDAHWAPQHELLDPEELNHVGRAERPHETSARLQAHVGDARTVPTDVPRENANPIRFSPVVYDPATAEIVNRLYARDLVQFGYPPLEPPPRSDADWAAEAERRLPVVDELVERHLRIGELLQMLRESEWQVARLARRLGRSVEREREWRRQSRRAARQSAQDA